MKALNAICVISLLLFNHNVWAYGSGSSTKACAKPTFSEFTPAEKTEVKAGSDFSFLASANTYPETVKVTVKEAPVTVNIANKNGTAFKVSGKVPVTLADSYARITINAESANHCKGSGGWLLKVSP